ncbi:MAG: DUF6580 family putative transport protein [Gemmataceae bacterium]
MPSETQSNDTALARICAVGMAVAAGLVRLIPHPLNFTPIDALALFGGARMRSWITYVLPLAVMAVSDVLLWAIQGRADFTLLQYAFNPWVYASFLLAVLWGRFLLRNGSAARIAAVSVLAGVQFFLVTNFGVWLADVTRNPPLPEESAIVWRDIPGLPAPVPYHYGHNLSGLVACYVAALPFAGTNAPPFGFLGNQLLGDLFYTGLLFGLYALLRGGVLLPRLWRQPAAARVP